MAIAIATQCEHDTFEDGMARRLFTAQEVFVPRRVIYPLIVAFALAVGCFLASTWYAGRVSAWISDGTRGIADDVVPSIVQLAATRGELRRLDLAATRFEQSRGERERADLMAARGDVDEAFERYLALPTSTGPDRRALASMHHGLREVDHVVSDLLAGTPTGTSEAVTRAIDAAASAIRSAVVFDADQAGDLATAIEADRSRSLAIAWGLDVLSAIMTAIMALLAVRGLLAYQRVLDAHRTLLEQRATELEQFAARVAHDVVSPLAVTRIAVESVLPDVSGALQRRLERAHRGLDRVVAIVDGLLDFARSGAQPSPGALTDVGSIAAGVVDELQTVARERTIALSLVATPESYVNANEGVIASLVQNFTRNALKYVGDREDPCIEVRVRSDARTVRLEVEDNGPGIPPQIRDTLWDPHVRGSAHGQPGLGLGLSTVKRIVQAHGGRYGVRSSVGGGSLFWCELARAEALAPPPATEPPRSDGIWFS